MRRVACVLSLLLAGCLSRSPSNASDSTLRERFRADREDFERLKDALSTNPKVLQLRFEDETTPQSLEQAGGLTPGWGEFVLRAAKNTGALGVLRDDRGVEIWMRALGIAPSGSIKSIVWSTADRSPLVDDTEHVSTFHGRQYARLAPEWYISLEWN